jgi:hypothetical protein
MALSHANKSNMCFCYVPGMTPFGSDCNERPKDEEDLTELALGATRALKAVHGTSFAAGPVCKIIYQVKPRLYLKQNICTHTK